MANISSLLLGIPKPLKSQLVDSYQAIVTNYIEHRWEPAELNGGKFCEAVYSIIEGMISGAFPSESHKIRDMASACRDLEKKASNADLVGDRSLRILIPRMMLPLYEIRNNRGVGHIGGDVNPNYLDATIVHQMASWILAELVRITHNVSNKEAQTIVDSIVERKCSLVWEIEGVSRVLDPSLSSKDKALVLLYGKYEWMDDRKLFENVEYSSMRHFKSRILKDLHEQKLIEYDSKNSRAKISPLGIRYVEQRIISIDRFAF